MRTDAYIIRTSDRKDFKQCRQRWDFNSKIRQNWEPNTTPQYLTFGTAIHAAMEVYYNPETWAFHNTPVVQEQAIAAFLAAYPKPTGYDGKPETDPQLTAEWEAERDLGVGMLRHYMAYYAERDKFTPVKVEIEFEIPIPVPDMRLPYGFLNKEGYLWYDPNAKSFGYPLPKPVLYQGRIDMIAQDEDGRYWVFDFKTTAKFDELHWLDLEEQITSYCWALQHVLGVPVAGFVYAELRKGVPGPPKILKSGKLSKDRSQDTTKELYLAAIAEHGLDVVDYEDFLDFLEDAPKQYFRREQIHRSQRELEIAGRRIALEAMDMVAPSAIYPSPSKINCNRCAYFAPCRIANEGGDVDYVLNENFHQRESTP